MVVWYYHYDFKSSEPEISWQMQRLHGNASMEKMADYKTVVVDTICGKVTVHVHGQMDEHKAVFLTVHDIGSNSALMRDFVESAPMNEVRARSVFVHCDVPGQENSAADLNTEFPSILMMGELMIPEILDALHVPLVVGIGEGAGANILARFALRHPSRVLGLVLVHLVTAGVGFLETLKERILGKSQQQQRRQSSDTDTVNYIRLHRLGESEDPVGERRIADRIQTLNGRNLQQYIRAYVQRKEITSLGQLEVLLICGTKSPYASAVDAMYAKMDKTRTSLLKIDTVVPIIECPDKCAQSLLLFVKGLGLLTSCPQQTPHTALGAIGRRRTLSMEEYDVPRRRSSLSK